MTGFDPFVAPELRGTSKLQEPNKPISILLMIWLLLHTYNGGCSLAGLTFSSFLWILDLVVDFDLLANLWVEFTDDALLSGRVRAGIPLLLRSSCGDGGGAGVSKGFPCYFSVKLLINSR